MGQYERSINIAFDKLSGQILDADEVFNKNNDPFSTRKKYNNKELTLSCLECDQDLIISDSKYNRLHFKHKPGHDYCILASGQLSPRDHVIFKKIHKSKESERHKILKNKIGQLLYKVDEIEKSSIVIDTKFLIRGNEKRRPDVYCKYKGKELVFEIQLSDLSLGYILSRYNFYKKHNMYLIWILDNFDIHNQGTLERDIKYLTQYENFFRLDESSSTFRLECDYKFPFLTSDNKFLIKWLRKSVSLSQLKFDNESFQAYYYNFALNKTKKEKERSKKVKELEKAELKQIATKRLAYAKVLSKNIIEEIKDLRLNKSQNFSYVSMRISELNSYEIKILNSTLGFTKISKTKKPVLINWIDKATKEDIAFFDFILNCNQIEFDINEMENDKRTVIQAIFENNSINKHFPFKSLFQSGYRLSKIDEKYLSKNSELGRDIINRLFIYNLCTSLSNKSLFESAVSFSKLILIIESAKRNEIIGFSYKPNEWLAFANNAIQYHSEYWEYIELAFKSYGLWEKLIELDKKGTFSRKVQSFYLKMPEQKFDFDEIFSDLYPEIYI